MAGLNSNVHEQGFVSACAWPGCHRCQRLCHTPRTVSATEWRLALRLEHDLHLLPSRCLRDYLQNYAMNHCQASADCKGIVAIAVYDANADVPKLSARFPSRSPRTIRRTPLAR